MGTITNKYIQQYIDMVESGEIKTCPEQKKLVNYTKKVFEMEDIYTDDMQMERYMGLQKYFPFQLFPWQKFVFAVHMITYNRDGTLRWPELLIFVTRGAGKNGYLEFEDFCCTTPIHGVQGYDISTYATGEDNARRSFDELHSILESDKKRFKTAYRWNQEKIVNLKTNSTITYKTSNHETKDGGREGKINFDEVHSYKDFKLYNVAITGLGKKRFARITYTSTQGFNRDSVLDMLLERSNRILDGQEKDGGLFPFMCLLHSLEDVVNPNKWEECNPSLIYFPELKRSYERELAMYKSNPGMNTSFPVKRCNFLVDTLDSICRREDIVACTEGILPENLDFLKGCNAVVGVDYAQINDMMTAGLLLEKNGVLYWLSHSWICENSEDFKGIRFDLQAAQEREELTILGKKYNSLDPQLTAEWLQAIAEKLQIQIIGAGADGYRVAYLTQAMNTLGLPVETRQAKNNYGRQKYRCYINRPSNNEKVYPILFQKLTDHKLYCGENLTMRWMMGNIAKDERDGALRIVKIERHKRKTDGVYALIAALAVHVDLCAGNNNNTTGTLQMPIFF